ncbi:NAD-dependent epimerase/dehydratase family protein [Allonocardiopsis opalescens]|uniref:Nucleoside-diphosphate-sugar epimerase n=1 Tax=Allonocardiopsis opalescens TaxID=1144618 RepID=A0A2T0Q4L2_9ACTN|nr:NAD-dependent epimerase/dehydratase family protein [Allonocardiopsis opalescens]PRX98699.1 nucleoside-diphosphate-sugar epimerase [Allonocardiopsis opalescens]
MPSEPAAPPPSAPHVVLGAGAIGAATAVLLAERGHPVRVLTRSGSGPDRPGITRTAADGTDAAALRAAFAGAAAVHVCTNPPYHRWSAEWPPLLDAVVRAAADTGTSVVLAGNLYGYGPVDGPMTEDTPPAPTTEKGRVRARMWERLLAEHQAGRLRAAEVRGSDYFGPGGTAASHLGSRFVPPLLAGRTARVIGEPDAPHTWTYLPDFARLMVAVATSDTGWGRPWHVPSAPPAPARRIAAELAELAGLGAPRVAGVPRWQLRLLGAVDPQAGALTEMYYQFDRPFEMDSAATAAAFGLTATPLREALRATLDWWRGPQAPGAGRG